MKFFKTLNRHKKGQAIFEFLVFTPFLLLVMSSLVSVGSAINASINQQKVSRGYYYHLLKGNSTYPPANTLTELGNLGLTSVGMYVIGWKFDESSDQPIAPCFQISSILRDPENETCESGPIGLQSNFIRVKTAYGSCSATYVKEGNNFVRFPNTVVNTGQVGVCGLDFQ